MKIIVGLGNPGAEYRKSRHNTGFMVLDRLAQKLSLSSWRCKKNFKAEIVLGKSHLDELVILVKPQTFMNNSGEAVRAVLDYYKKEIGEAWQDSLYIVYDDLDLILGSFKIQPARGPKIHNGLLSINQHLKTLSFWHVRVGIDGRNGIREIPGSNYLLQNFSLDEVKKLDEIIDQITTILMFSK